MSIRLIFSNLRQSIHKATRHGRTKGFSLIELLVVLAMMSMISGVVLVSNSTFSSRMVIDNLAHSIALTIREAQTYALSVKEDPSGDFPGYGVHFDSMTPTQFVIFADSDGDRIYDPGSGCGSGSTECLERKILNNGMHILMVSCVPGCTSPNLDITFTRPNPDARIRSGAIDTYAQGIVTLQSSKGFTRTISVWTTGQISVQ
jgi:prepilin-type N-terminal cleavage/methylation domain-containing protein